MKRRSLKDIDALLGPRRVTAARAVARRKLQAMLLSQVRKQVGFTQAALAKTLGITQSALSQMEAQDDLQLSTLRRLVAALGGELDVVARFGDRSVLLVDSGGK